MLWLVFGVLYSCAYVLVGWLLRDQPIVLSWFRAVALLVLPMTGTIVIVRRRQAWSGCQWLFWATVALGLTMSAIGLMGWAADELVFARDTWLAWPAVFALFGGVAPLFGLLAQPHRGVRAPLAATTAIDIAGLAVVTGFLYSFFVNTPDSVAGASGLTSASLMGVSELQQALVALGMIAATVVARGTPWRSTYRRLALGAIVGFVMLTMSNYESGQGLYGSGFVYDFTWILPFAFFPWAATAAPASVVGDAGTAEPEELTRPRPWVIFAAVALLPFLDFGLRRLAPADAFTGFRDLSTAVTLISVLSLLVARIAAERAELQQASGTTRLLAQVIEQAHELILVLTPDGRYRHANAAFCQALGHSREELQTFGPGELLSHEALSAGDIGAFVRDRDTWRGTVTRTRKDGTTFPVAASVAALLSTDGTTTHVVSVEQDVTEERRLQEQLIHSERLSAVGQLVAGVAHEINNPLQSVMGFTELLINAEQRPEVLRDLKQIRADAERAARIVRDLLLFARRETLERSVADLNAIVRSTLALQSFELDRHGITLHQEYRDDVPLIVASPAQIQQIVVNLVQNAEHAVSNLGRPGTITVRTSRLDQSAVLEVSDDGAGVKTEVAGRIFEPFFTTKGVGQGTGLGLSVSVGIARAHGGSLTLVPTESGACFRLTLPAASIVHVDLSASPTQGDGGDQGSARSPIPVL